MVRSFSSFCVLCLLAACLAPNADAAWWWPFGKTERRLPAAEQTERAEPIFNRAALAQARGDLNRAARLFKKVWEDLPGSDQSAVALFQFGRIFFERKEWKESFSAFQLLLQRHPDFPDFDTVVLYQFKIALAHADGDNIHWLWVIPGRAYERSAAYFEILISNAPYSDLAPLALMNIALIYQHTGDTFRAIDALDRLINLYPSSVLADDAYLELGETYFDLTDGPLYDQGATREAMSYFQDFLVLFPEHPKVGEGEKGLSESMNAYAESKLVIGEFYYRHRNWYRAAEIFFNEAITIAPDSDAAEKARQYLVRIEEFKAAAEADPNFVPPRTTWAERIFFWRTRSTDLRPEDADRASSRANAEASPTSTPESGVRE